MTTFNTLIQNLVNSPFWNQTPAAKKTHKLALPQALRMLPLKNTQYTLHNLASKTVTLLEDNLDKLSQVETATLDKLEQIFSRIPSSDPLVFHLKKLRKETFEIETPHEAKKEAPQDLNFLILCDLISKGLWEKIILHYRDDPNTLAHYGDDAFYEGLITKEQYTTLMILWSLLNELPKTQEIFVRRIFEPNGELNQDAKKCIEKTFKNPYGTTSILNDSQKETFFKRMLPAKDSEKVFFCIEVKPYRKHSPNQTTRTREIVERVGKTDLDNVESIYHFQNFNIFNQFEHEETHYRLIPSFTMMEEFLSVSMGKKGMKLSPRIGMPLTDEILRNGKNHLRALPLPSVNSPLPKEYSLPTPLSIDHMYVNFIACFYSSHISPKIRLLFLSYASFIAPLKSSFEDPAIRIFLDEYEKKCLDLQNVQFIEPERFGFKENFTDVQLFLYTLKYYLLSTSNHLEKHSLFGLRKHPTLHRLELELLLIKHQVFEKLAKLLHKERFSVKHGITQEDLTIVSRIATKNQIENFQKMKKIDDPQKPAYLTINGEHMDLIQASLKSYQGPPAFDIATQLLIQEKKQPKA